MWHPPLFTCLQGLEPKTKGENEIPHVQESDRLTYVVSNWDNPSFDAAYVLDLLTGKPDSQFRQELAKFVSTYVAADGTNRIMCGSFFKSLPPWAYVCGTHRATHFRQAMPTCRWPEPRSELWEARYLRRYRSGADFDVSDFFCGESIRELLWLLCCCPPNMLTQWFNI